MFWPPLPPANFKFFVFFARQLQPCRVFPALLLSLTHSLTHSHLPSWFISTKMVSYRHLNQKNVCSSSVYSERLRVLTFSSPAFSLLSLVNISPFSLATALHIYLSCKGPMPIGPPCMFLYPPSCSCKLYVGRQIRSLSLSPCHDLDRHSRPS